MGTVRRQNALVRLLEALEAEKIRYVMIGMSAAVAQGVMASTLDVDLWIDLPALGGTIAANTVVYLEDGTPVNFVYEVTGLGACFGDQAHQSSVHWRSSHADASARENCEKQASHWPG